MMSRFVYWSRAAYLVTTLLMVAGVLFVVFMAGMSLFSSARFWGTHMNWGYNAGLFVGALIVLALPSRLPRANARWLIALLILYGIQTVLPALRTTVPAVAALHPVNALVIFGVSIAQARAAWALVRASRKVNVPATPPVREGA